MKLFWGQAAIVLFTLAVASAWTAPQGLQPERTGRTGTPACVAELSREFEPLQLARLGRLVEQLDPGRESEYRAALVREILTASRDFRVDPLLVLAVIRVESRFQPHARSSKGALGLMQVLPGTAAEMVRRHDFQLDGSFEHAANVRAGTAYLAELLRRFKDPAIALTAYNVGPVGLRRLWREHGRVPPPYDIYAERVLRTRRRLEQRLDALPPVLAMAGPLVAR